MKPTKPKASKGRKKGWRKVDITDFEEFLEDQRLQERTGGLVAEKTDDQLFQLDSAEPKPVVNVIPPPVTGKTKVVKTLKCYANLEPDTKVPPIVRSIPGGTSKKKNRVTKPLKRLTKSIEKRKSLRSSPAKHNTPDTLDLWGNEEEVIIEDHYATVTKRKRVKTPNHFFNKPSALKAVEAPHPGSSYNPAYDDHQELLQEAIRVQVSEDLEEKKIEKRMKPDYSTAGGAPTKESSLKEMAQGLGMNDDSDQSEESEHDQNEDSDEETTKKRIKIKTRTQRNKQKRLELEARNKKLEKQSKQREDRNRTDKIQAIQKQVNAYEKKLAERAELKKAKLARLPYTTRRLHKDKFKPAEIDVMLTEELSGSMRLAKSRNNLLEDRYNSLQKRNIIEPRGTTVHTRRRKVRHTEKMGYREITLSSKAGGGIVIPHLSKKLNE